MPIVVDFPEIPEVIDDDFVIKYFESNHRWAYAKAPKRLVEYLENRFSDGYDSLKEVVARIRLHIERRPVCEICGGRTSFWGGKKHTFSRTCSKECALKLNAKSNAETCMNRYGKRTWSQTEEGIKQAKEIWASRSEENKEAIKKTRAETNMRLYNVENCWQSEEKARKAKETKIERYNDENYINPEKAALTLYLNHGVTNAAQLPTNVFKTDNPMHHQECVDKIAETNTERYGTKYYSQSQDYRNRLDEIKEKSMITCYEKHGVDFYVQSEEYKERLPEIISKQKHTQTERYKDYEPSDPTKGAPECYTQTKEFIEKYNARCQENYGVDWYTQTEEYAEKNHASRVRNGSFNTSKPEEEFEELLKEICPDAESQHRDKRYSRWHADFYIPSLDLFIELNYFWTHHTHQFNPNDTNDIALAEEWKKKSETHPMYVNALYIWCDLDPRRIACAKEHNLNYVVLWNKQEGYEFLESLKKGDYFKYIFNKCLV